MNTLRIALALNSIALLMPTDELLNKIKPYLDEIEDEVRKSVEPVKSDNEYQE